MHLSYPSLSKQRRLFEPLVIGLLLLLYVPLLLHWYGGWLQHSLGVEHDYFSHGIIGFPLAGWISWKHRHRWHRLPDTGWNHSGTIGGIFLLLLGSLFYLSSLPDLINLSLPVVLTGICLALKGRLGLRAQGFPLLLVLLATPTAMPYLIAPYTLPLQSFIATAAGFILLQLGMNVTVQQIYLLVDGRVVEIAPYCAGLKLLFTTLYVGLMLLYWSGDWTRTKTLCLLLGAVVISLCANIFRNTLLTFFYSKGQQGAFDWLHEGWGGDLYSAAMLGLLLPLLNQIERLLGRSRQLSSSQNPQNYS